LTKHKVSIVHCEMIDSEALYIDGQLETYDNCELTTHHILSRICDLGPFDYEFLHSDVGCDDGPHNDLKYMEAC
jgi:hypothetical protein